MAYFTGPNIVTAGLVFAVDAGSARSYPGSGTTVTDLITSNTGTLTNGVGFSTSNAGTWVFDGVDDYINIPNYTAHQSTTGTIEAWVKPDILTGNRYAFGAGGTTTVGASRALRISGGNWSIVGYGSGSTSGQDWNDIANATTNWQHVAIAWNGTTYYFYLNGVRSSNTRTGIVTPTGSLLRIGCPPFATNSNTDGQIAALKCYSNVLTEAQMLQNFNAQKSRFGL